MKMRTPSRRKCDDSINHRAKMKACICGPIKQFKLQCPGCKNLRSKMAEAAHSIHPAFIKTWQMSAANMENNQPGTGHHTNMTQQAQLQRTTASWHDEIGRLFKPLLAGHMHGQAMDISTMPVSRGHSDTMICIQKCPAVKVLTQKH